ncbi:MAG TPA: hypothetical protein VGK74_19965 [Symbiobacteriaceae bacterium]|jgi:Pyruvate/2-oxoacid:ferredoxin oxidoreductase gamma subunit
MALDTRLVEQATSEFHVAAPGGQGARALACMLADVGQMHGLSALSKRSGTDPQKVRGSHQTETATVRFSNTDGQPFRVTAVMHPELMDKAGDGLLLVNCRQPIETGTVRSIDAAGIAQALGVPAYLPMLGALAKSAGWADLNRVKTAVKMILEDLAPYWVEPGLAAVEAGYCSLA